MNHRHNRRNPFTPVLAALLAFQLLLTACTQGTGSSSSDAPSAPGSTASQASSPAAEPGSGEKRADQITIAIQAEPDTLNPYNVSGGTAKQSTAGVLPPLTAAGPACAKRLLSGWNKGG